MQGLAENGNFLRYSITVERKDCPKAVLFSNSAVLNYTDTTIWRIGNVDKYVSERPTLFPTFKEAEQLKKSINEIREWFVSFNTGTKNATWNGSATATRGSYGSFTVSVASGSTLTQSASTLANTAIVGEGNVSITDLHLYPSLDLRSISNSGAQNAYWNGSSGSFTGHLGSFTTTVGTGSSMGISAERATNKNIVGIGSARVSIGGIRQAPDSNFSQISAKVSIDSNSGGPSTFTGNLGSLRSLSHYTRLSGSVNGDKIAFASSSGPQPDGLSVTENGQWHWNSTNDILTYCVNGVTYRLEIFGAEEVTHSDNYFTISR
jgi:hypothetical protein